MTVIKVKSFNLNQKNHLGDIIISFNFKVIINLFIKIKFDWIKYILRIYHL